MKRSLPSLGRPSVRPNRPVGRDSVAGTRAAFCAPVAGGGAVWAPIGPAPRASTPRTIATTHGLRDFMVFLLACRVYASPSRCRGHQIEITTLTAHETIFRYITK